MNYHISWISKTGIIIIIFPHFSCLLEKANFLEDLK